jgi:glutathione S-transferase
MTELFLYHTPGACSRVTMNALEEAGLEYGDLAIDIAKEEQKTADYLKIHPGGKVPALAVDDKVLTENAAILIFISLLRPEANLLPAADSPFELARHYSDLIWCSDTVHPTVRQVRAPFRFTDSETAGVFNYGVKQLNALLTQVEARVSGGRWWYGRNWSIVDVYLYWCYTTAASGDYSLAAFPAIQAHEKRVEAKTSYQTALARELTAMKKAGIDKLR